MNNLEKLKLLNEMVDLRRRAMKLDESTAASSEGPGSRTGMDENVECHCGCPDCPNCGCENCIHAKKMDENAFAQDAEVSSDRKRSAEGKSEPLEEGLKSYWKIVGLR